MSDSTPDDEKRHASARFRHGVSKLYDDTAKCQHCGTTVRIVPETFPEVCRSCLVASLTTEYQTWCYAQKLPWIDADELLHEDIDTTQREWLNDFIKRWDSAMETY